MKTTNASPAKSARGARRPHAFSRRAVLTASGVVLAAALSLFGVASAFVGAPLISPGAVVRHAPDIQGSGKVLGSVRQTLADEDTELVGEDISLTGGATITGDLLVPGTPTVVTNGNPTFGGVVVGAGSALPANFKVKLAGNVTLGRLVTHTDPVPLTGVAAVPAASGTRDVSLSTAGQSAGDFSTLRDLTLAGAAGEVAVPPGTYRRFAATGATAAFVFGQAGATSPSVYNLDELSLDQGASLRVAGPVRLNVARSVSLTNGGKAGSQTDALLLALNVSAVGVTGDAVLVEGGSTLAAVVRAPSGKVALRGNSVLKGTSFSDRLSINGSSTLNGVGDSTAPTLNVTEPPDNFSTKTPLLVVRGTVTDQTQTTVTVAGVAAAMSGDGFTAQVTLSQGQNTLKVVATDLFGNQSERTLNVNFNLDTTAPAVNVVSPAEGLVTKQPQVSVSGTFEDASPTVIKVNGVTAVIDGNQFSAAVSLAEGPNTLTVSALDSAGNASETLRHVTLDTAPPAVTLAQPADGLVTKDGQLAVSGTYADASAVTVTVGGAAAAAADGGFSATVALNEGSNPINVTATDAAGNTTTLSLAVVRDSAAPALSVALPAEGAYLSATEATVTGTLADATASVVKVNGVTATLSGDAFSAVVPLTEGANELVVTADDAAGNHAEVRRAVVRDTTAPTLDVSQPADGLVTADGQIIFTGTFADASPVSVNVSGVAATLNGNSFTATIPVNAGQLLLIAHAVDAAGNEATAERKITVAAPLELVLTLPAENEQSASREVKVEGSVGGSGVSVKVNGQPFALVGGAVFGGYLELPEGASTVTVEATDVLGRTQTLTRAVNVDTTAPVIGDLAPAQDALVAEVTTTVAGRVTDATAVVLKVNDVVVATAADGTFTLANFAVAEGQNTLNVEAVDALGNRTLSQRTFRGKDHTAPSAAVVFPVPAETRLAVLQVEGRAEPGALVSVAGGVQAVTAEAAEGTGLFFATVGLSLGDNALTVTSADKNGNVSAPVVLNVKCDPGLTRPAGQPFQLHISTNDAQKGLVGQELARPLIVRVTDQAGDAVSGVAVTFTAAYGGGSFVGGGAQYQAATDAEGHASARYVGGPVDGFQYVRADFAGNPSRPVSFSAELLAGNPAAPTTASGLVLDQNGRSLPNVLVRLGGQQTRTGTDGRFSLTNVAVGPHQVLELVGRDQVPFPGRWPNISYDLDVLPGVDNHLGRPLFLPRVNGGVEMPVGADGRLTSDAVYELPAVGGLPPVRITARAGTHVQFPPDVTDRRLSVTRIPVNRTPMTLEDGRATNLYISVQPSGAIFDPPLEVSFPNLDNLAPGSEVLLMSFDHDAGRYVQMGTGHVGADGREVTSDPGQGIRVGAWHALPPDPPAKEATVLGHIQVEGNPAFEGQDVEVTEASVAGVRAVPYSQLRNAEGVLSRVLVRALVPMPDNTPKVEPVVAQAKSAKPEVQIDAGAFDYKTKELFIAEKKDIQLEAGVINALPNSTYTYTCSKPDQKRVTVVCAGTSITITGSPIYTQQGTDDPEWHPGSTELKVTATGSSGGKAEAKIKVSLVRVKYKEEKTNSGFDDLVKGKIQDKANPKFDSSGNFLGDNFIDDPNNYKNKIKDPWLTVVMNGDQTNPAPGGTQKAKYEVEPDKAAQHIKFESDTPATADVTADTSKKLLTVEGKAAAETFVKAKLTSYKATTFEVGKLEVVVRKRVKVNAAFFFLKDTGGHEATLDPGSLADYVKEINEILTPQTGIQYEIFRVYHWDTAKNVGVPAGAATNPAKLTKDFGGIIDYAEWDEITSGKLANGTASTQPKVCDQNAVRDVFIVWNVEEKDPAPTTVSVAGVFDPGNRTIMADSRVPQTMAHEIGHSFFIEPSDNAYEYWRCVGGRGNCAADSPHSNVYRELMFAVASVNGVGHGSHIPKHDVDAAAKSPHWLKGGFARNPCP